MTAEISNWLPFFLVALAVGLGAGFVMNWGLRRAPLDARLRHGVVAAEVLLMTGFLFYALLVAFGPAEASPVAF